LAKILADAKINVVALLGSSAGAQGSAQVVVDKFSKAKKVVDKAKMSYKEGTLEQFELKNKPGALAKVTGKLAKKGINIESAYATTPKGAKEAVLLVTTTQKSTG
jgi:hypothetical protein